MANRPALLTAALFLVPVVLKLVVSAGVTNFGTDGYYYAGIAQHVAQGDGLTTRVSLFHHGYQTFPHPSPVYPVWPLLLGYTARIVGLDVAAVWLPTLFYFTALFFAWKWASGLPRAPLFERWPDGPDTAHAASWLLAWNVLFFSKTSTPYTEALAMTLLFACLWRAQRLWAERSLRAGVELGAWIGVIFLTRSQLVLVAMAAACAFAWALVGTADRKRTLVMAAACFVVAAGLVAPHYLRLREITVRPATGILRFEMAQANDVLPPVHVLTNEGGGLERVADRLRGVPVAFSPVHPLAYMRAYFGLQYALLLALPLCLIGAWRMTRREGMARAVAWIRDPDRLRYAFPVLFAAGGLVSLHLVHKDFGTEWHFGRRHALSAFLAFYLAWLFLAHQRRAGIRLFALVLLVASMTGGLTQMLRLTARSVLQVREHPSREKLIAFLDAQREPGRDLTVAMTGGDTQRMALLTADRVNYHWLHLGSQLADVETMFRSLGATLLLVNEYDERKGQWAFLHPRTLFGERFEQVATADGFAIYRMRAPSAATAVYSEVQP